MKRIIVSLLILSLFIAFVGCKKGSKNPEDTNNNESKQVNNQEEEQDKTTNDNISEEENKSTPTETKKPSKDDMDIFNSYLEKVQDNKYDDETKIQEELASEHEMTAEEVKDVYLKVWQHKIEEAEKLSK